MSVSILFEPNEDAYQVHHYLFDIFIAIQSHKSQGEPTGVRNGHQEQTRDIESKPEPLS
jgi:hypothetical protein